MNKKYYSLSNRFASLLNQKRDREDSRLKNIRQQVCLMFFLFLSVFVGQAQVATNGGSGLNATYPTLASAITALNGATITSPIVITLTGNETAPAGGYVITAEGTAANTIVIAGSSSTITAPTPQTAGALNDAIFKLVGADYVTIQGFTMLENAANTITAAGTNTMTEWGVALLYASLTNGAQNNTIVNNTIDLNRSYQNTFGIYCNATHSATAVTTSATATGANGGFHNLKIQSNTITDVNIGILVIGPTGAADHHNGLEIGGAVASLGNSITNFGSTGTFSGYANVSGSVNGILVRNVKNFYIGNNTITSSNGGVIAGTLRGIFVTAFTNVPTGTITNDIHANTISLRSGVASGAIFGILNEGSTVSATSTLNITSNDFTNFGHTVSGTGAITLISNVAATLNTLIGSNKFTNLSVNTTGNFTFITNSVTHPNNSVTNVSSNAIVTAFSKTGAGGTVYFYDSFGSTVSGTEVNSLNDFSNVTLTGATTLNGFRTADGGTSGYPAKIVMNNTFNNITNGNGSMTILNVGYSLIGGANNVSGNVISNITGANSIIGITSAAGDQNFYNNTISGLTTTGGNTVSAISITGGTLQNVYKNKIYNIEANNASGTVNGILVSGSTTVNLYNNIIGDLRTPIANAANPIVGINITGATAVNAFYNTVRLNATSTGTNFGSSAISVSTTPTVALRNNIFANQSTPNGTGLAVAYRRSGTSLTTYDAASNNNLFFGPTLFADGTNTDTTLATLKTRMGTRDSASVSENPNWVSTTGANANFLHIDTTIATQIESGGAPIATITDDFDGDVRNATTPDIGADEFTGVPSDITAPLIAHTVLANTCSVGSRTVTVTVTDASGVPTSGAGMPVAYWRINTGTYTAATATSMGSGQYQFTIGAGAALGDTVSYYFVAQDNAGTPNITALPAAGASGYTANPPAAATPPATPFSYSLLAPLNGVYTVGTAGTYTTITAAVADYNSRCLSGPVTFSLLDATYPTETFPITINTNPDANATNTLTIAPATGVTTTITGSNATTIFKISGADYVTFEGSNNGTTTRDLTIANTNAAGVVVWVASVDATNGALNAVFRNVKIIGNSSTSTVAGIVVSGATLGAAADAANTGFKSINNTFNKMQNGIFAIGNATTPDQGFVIADNVFGSTTTADKLGFRGVALQNAQGFVISGNQIMGVTTATTSTSSGILVGGVAINGNVFNNRISDVKNTNTTGYGSNGIFLNSNSAVANINVYNNFVSDVASYGYSAGGGVADNGYGIIINQGAGYNVYHNTVAMNTNQTVSGRPAAINVTVTVTATGAINLRNNILVNQQTQTGARYAIYSEAPNTVFTAIDYNNYYTTGTNLGYIGSDRANLAAIQTGFGGNVNSKNILPVFTSTTDLHLVPASNIYLDNTGTPIAGITTDIDGDTRNVTTPDMGADEFTSPVCTSAVGGTATATVATICASGTTTIQATGYSTGETTMYQWQSSSDLAFTAPVNEGTASATYADLTTGTITQTTYYRLVVTCAALSQANFSNVVTVTVNVTPQPTATAQSFCNSATVANLVATGTGIQWYDVPTGGAALASTTALATGPYFVTQTIAGCESTRLQVDVVVNVTPQPTATAQSFCNSATVGNLTATGTGIQWYDVPTGGTALASTTALATGPYFVTQTIAGCESTRLQVDVVVNVTPQPTATAQSFCNSATVGNLTATGTGIQWYDVPTGGTALASTAALATGNYYVTQTIAGCESPRLLVAVTVNVVNAPTGAATQVIPVNTPAEATIEDIVVTGTNVIWYPTSADAMAGTNAIAAGTQLVSGTTYYAMQTVGTCTSNTPLAVTVTVTLGTSSFDKAAFKYYPNPVSDVITISYSEPISTIEIYNMLGQKVITRNSMATDVVIDMSDLASGAYIAHVKSGNVTQEVRIIKK
ncbi:Ig-like domain-containing protein [Flavobacterium cerinum]|uniref:T9SS type A sorting domain-containing protein n=1 Tax=Flavobacterium cerinum TaxID=2502784 RepID=A0ABY5ITH8_9FLAO|nr:T9SS type A sorting domain-containing protein [Flavobacterium cerinum]UUC45641.1 T9SS type A sorting domain-containing protein [Flavobacterium cerinum]